jgi:hypothetical protein
MKQCHTHLAILVVCLAGMVAAPGVYAYAGQDGSLYFTNSTYQNNNAGEFNAVATGLGSFATFCLEVGENISQPPTGLYTYTINSGAVAGGGGAEATDPYTGLPMDNVSLGTAWLFSRFWVGALTLDTGAGSYFDANRLANAGKLQQAIWYLEDETGGVNNGYVSLAQTALGTNLAGIKVDANGAYGVASLNLFKPDGGLAQDQLVVVPEPGTTALLATASLLLAGATVRRRRGLIPRNGQSTTSPGRRQKANLNAINRLK